MSDGEWNLQADEVFCQAIPDGTLAKVRRGSSWVLFLEWSEGYGRRLLTHGSREHVERYALDVAAHGPRVVEQSYLELDLAYAFAFDMGGTLRTGEGREVVVDTSLSPIAGPQGATAGYVMACRDVTEQHRLDLRLDSAAEIAAAIHAQRTLGYTGGMVIANPIPAEHALPRARIDGAIAAALHEAQVQGISGKAVTPFLLDRFPDIDPGVLQDPASLPAALAANPALLDNLDMDALGDAVAGNLDKLDTGQLNGMLDTLAAADPTKAGGLIDALGRAGALGGMLAKYAQEGADFLKQLDPSKLSSLMKAFSGGLDFLKQLKAVADSATRLAGAIRDLKLPPELDRIIKGGPK